MAPLTTTATVDVGLAVASAVLADVAASDKIRDTVPFRPPVIEGKRAHPPKGDLLLT